MLGFTGIGYSRTSTVADAQRRADYDDERYDDERWTMLKWLVAVAVIIF
jgi:hypothetical protein